MKAIITVIGIDSVGIIAAVSTCLSDCGVNILDISQTIMQEYFAMIMAVDLEGLKIERAEMKQKLDSVGDEHGVKVHLQHEDIFRSMHRI